MQIVNQSYFIQHEIRIFMLFVHRYRKQDNSNNNDNSSTKLQTSKTKGTDIVFSLVLNSSFFC